MNTSTADISDVKTPVAAGAAGMSGVAGMSEHDLAEIIGAFNDVTTKLHGAHEALRSEVTRLKRELREANEQVERSRRLAALGEMAAGIAHEVRNPLGSIRLYARMLEQDLSDRPAERTIAEKIGGAVRGLDAVVGDVLAFAREMRVAVGPIDAEALLHDAVREGLGGEQAGIKVELRIDAGEIEGDAALLHRALVNVVRNAAEAMRESRRENARLDVSCEVEAMEMGAGECACYAISVRDTGPGIPSDVLPRMFNPFFTTRATGTGLGLSIVHRIIDAHGGRVVVKNVEGEGGTLEGAIVRLLIPAVRVRDENSGARGKTVQIEVRPGAGLGPKTTEEAA
jgi:signal transduction histidine kinase